MFSICFKEAETWILLFKGTMNPRTAIMKQKTVRYHMVLNVKNIFKISQLFLISLSDGFRRAKIIGSRAPLGSNGLPQGARMVSTAVLPPSRLSTINGIGTSNPPISGAASHHTSKPL